MKYKPITVRWRDSRRLRSDVYFPEEMEKAPLAIIETIGYGLELPDKIVLATEYYPELGDQSESYRELITIPRECVVEIKYLREREGKKNAI